MRAVVQRVSRATVRAEGETLGHIGRGLVVLVGVARDDGEADADYLAEKIASLRIFPDAEGKLNYSLVDVSGEALVVSQFTLLGDARRGRRPDFTAAAPPDVAEPLVVRFAQRLAAAGPMVCTGRFGAYLEVDLSNDGPVTVLLDSKKVF